MLEGREIKVERIPVPCLDTSVGVTLERGRTTARQGVPPAADFGS